MTQLNITAVADACDKLAHRIIEVEGTRHGAAFLFDQCMRAFDNKALPANSITFSVFIDYPVMKPGEATIHRDGTLEMRTTKDQPNTEPGR